MALPSMGHTSPATENVKLKQSIYETIIKIGATETPILNKIGTSKVTNPLTHSWITDTFEEPKKNANLELSKFVGETKNTAQKNYKCYSNIHYRSHGIKSFIKSKSIWWK